MTNELYHYGVLGMRWGVRKRRVGTGSGRRKKTLGSGRRDQDGTVRGSGRRKTTKYTDDSDLTKLSDDELRRRLNRVQMEKQYVQLTKKGASVGKKIAQEVLKEIGKEYLKTVVKGGLSKAGKVSSGTYSKVRDVILESLDPRKRFD